MAIDPNEIKLLQEMALFRDLDRDQLDRVLRVSVERSLSPEGFLFMQGDEAGRMYLVTAGRVRLSQFTPEGQQVTLRYVAPGEAFGVIAALSDAAYPVSAQAVEPGRALTWDRDALRNLMADIPQLALNALSILASRVREFQDAIRHLATQRVERRIARALLRLASQMGRKTPEGVLIDMPLSRQDLAELTGTTLYTVSRTLSAWETAGLVKTGREQVLIRFPHGLVTIAEDLPPSGAGKEDR